MLGLLALAGACAEPGGKDEHLPGPDASAATLETVAWAARVDADTTAKRVRCESAIAAEDGAVVHIRRGADSATNLVAVFGGTGGMAAENYYALGDRVRLFVRVDSSAFNPYTGKPAKKNVDSTWFADGQVIRWVDGLGRSRSLGRRSVGATAENIQKFYHRWLRTCPQR